MTKAAMASWHSDFVLGDWRVSPKLNRISRDGETVGIKHKSMAVLVFLADAKGEVLTRDEIMDGVWPGMEVTDDVLTQAIHELRHAFDDDAKHPRYIETIPRVGIRLIAKTTVAEEDRRSGDTVSVPQSSRRYLLATFAAIVVGAVLLSIIPAMPVMLRMAGYFPDNGDVWLLPLMISFAGFGGIALGILNISVMSAIADIADENELHYGRRQEGVLFAARTFFSKADMALGHFLAGITLDLISFPVKSKPGEVGVLEIPTPRWTTYDAVKLGVSTQCRNMARNITQV